MISFLPGINSTSSALNAERIRMEVVAQNIANANTTRDLDGQPYQRQQVVFESVLNSQMSGGLGGPGPGVLQVARIERDQRPPHWVFNPTHPDADARGMVAMPNVNIHEEMADLIAASRTFEANLAVVKNARAMALQTLAIAQAGLTWALTDGPDLRSALASEPGDPTSGRGMPGASSKVPSAAELESLSGSGGPSALAPAQPGSGFDGILQNLVTDVSHSQAAAGQAVNGLLSGQQVPLHQAVIAMEEASVSFQLMVEVRNKLLESYQELMRMQI